MTRLCTLIVGVIAIALIATLASTIGLIAWRSHQLHKLRTYQRQHAIEAVTEHLTEAQNHKDPRYRECTIPGTQMALDALLQEPFPNKLDPIPLYARFLPPVWDKGAEFRNLSIFWVESGWECTGIYFRDSSGQHVKFDAMPKWLLGMTKAQKQKAFPAWSYHVFIAFRFDATGPNARYMDVDVDKDGDEYEVVHVEPDFLENVTAIGLISPCGKESPAIPTHVMTTASPTNKTDMPP